MNEQKQTFKFKGTVIKSIYKSDNFSVYALNVSKVNYPDIKQNKYSNVSICGELQDLVSDVEYEIEATEQDTKYGVSYKVIRIKRDEPTTKEETYAFLREILTENQAETIINNYPDIISIVKENRTNEIDISKLKGIGNKSLEKIKNKIIENFYLVELVSEFGGILSLSVLRKIYEKYTSTEVLKKKLKEMPYTTLTQISGVGFIKADSIVLQLQKENVIDFGYNVETSPDRCLACVLFLLKQNEEDGNTKANLADIRSQVIKLTPECADHFVDVVKDESIYYDKITMDVALRSTYETEIYICERFKEALSNNIHWNIDYKQYKHIDGFELTDKQNEVLNMVCNNNISLLIGYAGAGKSTSMRALVEMLDDNKKSYILLASTGRASKVLKKSTNRHASTIHRGLMYNPSKNPPWTYNEDNKIYKDIVIVDESSMIDIFLMKHLLEAIDFNRTKLLLVGDPKQASSIGAGSMFNDAIKSNIIPCIMLDTIFRYSSGGLLKVATDVRNQKVYLPKDSSKIIQLGENRDYTFIKSNNEEVIKDVLNVYKKLLSQGYTTDDLQVLSAYNIGDYGSIALNNYIQRIANPNYGSDNHLAMNDKNQTVFYEGDIVIQKKNNYSAKIYNEEDSEAFCANGDIGRIIKIIKNIVVIKFDDIIVEYTKDDMSDVRLAYSISYHSSQGGSIRVPIIITPSQHTYFLNSNLLYVALTRTQEKCFHIGSEKTVNIAIKKSEDLNRKTFLFDLLKTFIKSIDK